MKTSTLLLLSCYFLVFSVFGQHDHEETEHFFQSKSLAVFENDLLLTDTQLANQAIRDLLDQEYQDFHLSIETRLHADEHISDSSFQASYDKLLLDVTTLINGQKLPAQPSQPGPPGGGPKALNGPCVNMDFETGDLSGWTLTRGDVDGLSPYSFVGEFGVGPGPYHQIYGGGVDPVTGIPRVNPDGGAFSVRLGNGTGVGARAARMKQTFLVDATNAMFTYSYAVIFQSPAGHTLNQLPYFTVRVIDSLGNSVPCGEYSVIADAASAPSYQTTNWGWSTVLYQDWQTVFANLTAYIGQNVTVEFTSGDCSLTGHFGYAYIDASCGMGDIIASSPIICQGDSSLLTAPAGASSYLWNTGDTTQTIYATSGGNYTCELTPSQGGGCSIILDIDITENPSPTAAFIANNYVGCLGDSIHFTDQSTIPNPGNIVNYRWDFGDGIITPISNGAIVAVPQTNGTYTNPAHLYAAAGPYTAQLYVESADGCTDSTTVNITINGLPIVGAGPDQTVCEGVAVTLNGSGAVNYAWDNGVTDGVPFVQGVGTITYTVTGTDGNGCQNTDQVDVTVNPLPVVGAGADQTVCEGVAVTLNGSGAVNYAWDNGVTDGVPFVQGVGTITYTVTGTDGNGCQNTDQVDVTVNPLPVVVAGVDLVVCEGVAVTLNGSGAVNYAWDNGVTDGVPFIQGVGTITYTVTGTDGNGCQNTDQVDVIVHALPTVVAQDVVICDGNSAILNAQGAMNYNWTNGVMNGVPFYPNETGQYIVIGTDINGCSSSDTVTVIVNPTPNASFSINNLSLTTSSSSTGFTNNSTGAVDYVWNFGDGSPLSQEFEPYHTFPFDQGGEYEITLTVYSAEGCPDVAQKYVHVFQDYTIYVPNAFTPDANGVNEIFKPVMEGFDEDDFTLYIFNRWGQLIFESHDMNVGWDGKFAQQDYQTQDGVYTWKIVAGLKDSSDSKIFVGHVSLLK